MLSNTRSIKSFDRNKLVELQSPIALHEVKLIFLLQKRGCPTMFWTRKSSLPISFMSLGKIAIFMKEVCLLVFIILFSRVFGKT